MKAIEFLKLKFSFAQGNTQTNIQPGKYFFKIISIYLNHFATGKTVDIELTATPAATKIADNSNVKCISALAFSLMFIWLDSGVKRGIQGEIAGRNTDRWHLSCSHE